MSLDPLDILDQLSADRAQQPTGLESRTAELEAGLDALEVKTTNPAPPPADPVPPSPQLQPINTDAAEPQLITPSAKEIGDNALQSYAGINVPGSLTNTPVADSLKMNPSQNLDSTQLSDEQRGTKSLTGGETFEPVDVSGAEQSTSLGTSVAAQAGTGLAGHPSSPQHSWEDITNTDDFKNLSPDQKLNVVSAFARQIRDWQQYQPGADAHKIDERTNDWIMAQHTALFPEVVDHSWSHAAASDLGNFIHAFDLQKSGAGLQKLMAAHWDPAGASPVEKYVFHKLGISDSDRQFMADIFNQAGKESFTQSEQDAKNEGVDPKLEGTFGTEASRFLGGVGSIFGLGHLFIPLSATRAYAQALHDSGGDQHVAYEAMGKDALFNVVFMKSGEAVGKLLPETAGRITRAMAQSGGNLTTQQLLNASEAAYDAKPGDRKEAFFSALSHVDLGQSVGAIAYGILPAVEHPKEAIEIARAKKQYEESFKTWAEADKYNRLMMPQSEAAARKLAAEQKQTGVQDAIKAYKEIGSPKVNPEQKAKQDSAVAGLNKLLGAQSDNPATAKLNEAMAKKGKGEVPSTLTPTPDAAHFERAGEQERISASDVTEFQTWAKDQTSETLQSVRQDHIDEPGSKSQHAVEMIDAELKSRNISTPTPVKEGETTSQPETGDASKESQVQAGATESISGKEKAIGPVLVDKDGKVLEQGDFKNEDTHTTLHDAAKEDHDNVDRYLDVLDVFGEDFKKGEQGGHGFLLEDESGHQRVVGRDEFEKLFGHRTSENFIKAQQAKGWFKNAQDYITKAEARGNSRPVTMKEFRSLAKKGKALLDKLRSVSSPTTGLEGEGWEKLKGSMYDETRKPWGGGTINPTTGELFTPKQPKAAGTPKTPGYRRNEGPYAVTARDSGQPTVSVPENGTREEFDAAMEKAKVAYPQLANQDHYLGIFHDDAHNRIGIDPVLIVKTPAEVEAIGAHTHAIGGAFDYATGDGYFPPHVAEPEGSAKKNVTPTTESPKSEALHQAVEEDEEVEADEERALTKAEEARSSFNRWTEETHQGVSAALQAKGIDAKSIGWTRDATEKMTAVLNRAGYGRQELIQVARDGVQAALLKNVEETGNPLQIKQSNGKVVPFNYDLVARRDVGHEIAKKGYNNVTLTGAGDQGDIDLSAEDLEKQGGLGRNEGARSNLRSTPDKVLTAKESDKMVSDYHNVVTKLFASFSAKHAESFGATSDQVLKATRIVLDRIGREEHGIRFSDVGESVFGDERGLNSVGRKGGDKAEGTLAKLVKNEFFREAVRSEIYDKLAQHGKTVERESLYRSAAEPSDRKEVLKKMAERVKAGIPMEQVMREAPTDVQRDIKRVANEYRTDLGVNGVLNAIAEGEAKTPREKLLATLAKALRPLGDNPNLKLDPLLSVNKLADALYDGRTGNVEANPLAKNFVENIIHEKGHSITQPKIDYYLNGQHDRLSKGDLATLKSLDTVRDFALNHATVSDAIRNAAKGADKQEQLERFEASDAPRHEYGLLNLHEFAEGVKSSAKFQDMLSKIELSPELLKSLAKSGIETKKDTSVWAAVKRLFRKLTFGDKPISESSALAKAFDLSIDLTKTNTPGEQARAEREAKEPPKASIERVKELAHRAALGTITNIEEKFFGDVWPKMLQTAGKLFDASKVGDVIAGAQHAANDMAVWMRDNPTFANYYNTDLAAVREVLSDKLGRPLTDDEDLIFKLADGLTSPNTGLAANTGDAVRLLHLWIKEGNFHNTIKMVLRDQTHRDTNRDGTPNPLGGQPKMNKAGDKVLQSLVIDHETVPISISGTSANNKARSLIAISKLVHERFGGSVKDTVAFMNEGVTKAELQAFNKEMGYKAVEKIGDIEKQVEFATGQSEKIPRWFIFGHKVGAYTMNLVGDHRFNTTDVWESRLIRSYFKGMFAENTGMMDNAQDTAIVYTFAKAFKEEVEAQTGRTWENSALQAVRWFYMLDAARKTGYTRASTNETISHYAQIEADKIKDFGGVPDSNRGGQGNDRSGQPTGTAEASPVAGPADTDRSNAAVDQLHTPVEPTNEWAPATAENARKMRELIMREHAARPPHPPTASAVWGSMTPEKRAEVLSEHLPDADADKLVDKRWFQLTEKERQDAGFNDRDFQKHLIDNAKELLNTEIKQAQGDVAFRKDQTQQADFLNSFAKEHGFEKATDMAIKSPDLFNEAADLYRSQVPSTPDISDRRDDILKQASDEDESGEEPKPSASEVEKAIDNLIATTRDKNVLTTAVSKMREADTIPAEIKTKVYQKLARAALALDSTRAQGPLGVKTFVDEDVTPLLQKGVDAAKEFGMWFVNKFAPTARVDRDLMDTLMKGKGHKDEVLFRAAASLENSSKVLDKMGREEQVAFVDRIKASEKQPTPELQTVADLLRHWDNALFQMVKEFAPGVKFLENHMRVLWKIIPDSPEAQGTEAGKVALSNRPWQGTKGMLKGHTLESMSEGIALGGVPADYNPVKLQLLAVQDAMKFVAANKVFEALKDTGALEYVRTGTKPGEGYTELKDSIAKVYFPISFKYDPKSADLYRGFKSTGEYHIEEGIGRLINNFLSRDHVRESAVGQGLMDLKNMTTAIELSMSPFHMIFEMNETVGSSLGLAFTKLTEGDFKGAGKDLVGALTSPYSSAKLGGDFIRYAKDAEGFRANNPDAYDTFIKNYPKAEELVQDLFDGGGQLKMHMDNEIKAGEGFQKALEQGNWGRAVSKALPALNKQMMKPLFETLIPRLKLGMYLREYSFELQRRGRDLESGKLTRGELSRKTWEFVEDRFGELNWDNLFWDRTFKSGMQLMFRSVTWKLGNVRGFGKAIAQTSAEAVNAVREGRRPHLPLSLGWLLGMSVVTALQSSVISKATTGQYPWELAEGGWELLHQLAYPRIDSKDPSQRVSIPTYWRDAVHLVHAPGNYVTSSTTGEWGRVWDIIRNKDFYGTEIMHPDDPWYDKGLEALKHMIPVPFGVSSLTAAFQTGERGVPLALTGLGYTKAPYTMSHTPAEIEASELSRNHFKVGSATAEQHDRSVRERQAVEAIKRGDITTQQAIENGSILKERSTAVNKKASMSSFEYTSGKLDPNELLKVYKKASVSERTVLDKLFTKKVNGSRSLTQGEKSDLRKEYHTLKGDGQTP